LLGVGVFGEVYFEAFELDAGGSEAAEKIGECVLDLDAGLGAGDLDAGIDAVVGLLEFDGDSAELGWVEADGDFVLAFSYGGGDVFVELTGDILCVGGGERFGSVVRRRGLLDLVRLVFGGGGELLGAGRVEG